MSFGAIMTKPGYDITTADPRGWNLNTLYPNLKVVTSGTTTPPVSPPSSPAVITHNLGYNPIAIIYGESITATGEYVLLTGDTAGGQGYIVNDTSDLDNIYVYGLVPGTPVYYYVFYDPTLE